MATPWQITYRAVLRAEVPSDQVLQLDQALKALSGELPGRVIRLAEASSGTVFVGEIGVDPRDASEAGRLLGTLSDLARRFPTLDIQADDTWGLVTRDDGSGEFAIADVGDPDEDPIHLRLDPWGSDSITSPFGTSPFGDGEDAMSDTRRLACVADGAVTDGFSVDLAARYGEGSGGRILSLQGTLESAQSAAVHHLFAQEFVVRAADGCLLARGAREIRQDFWRMAEIRVSAPLRAKDVEAASVLELWVDVAERSTRTLARYRPGRGLEVLPSPGLQTHVVARAVEWPLPGLALLGEITHNSEALLCKAVVRFAVHDARGCVIEEDESELGPLIPGESRSLGFELAWGLDDTVASGEVTLSTVTRRRVLVWRGELARLTLCR